MGRLLENRCLQLPHRFLDSAFGLARNDRFGVVNDPEVIMPGSPSASRAGAAFSPLPLFLSLTRPLRSNCVGPGGPNPLNRLRSHQS